MSNSTPVEIVDDEDFDDAVVIVDDEDFDDAEDFDEVAPVVTDAEHLNIVQIDPATGQETEFTIDMSMPPLGVDEAKELTERIRTSVNVVYVLLKRAHAGRAWAALGYDTFEAYVKEEFKISRSYAYKLLNQANVIETIEAVAPEGTQIYIGEGVARNIKKVLPEVLAEIETRIDDVDDPQQAGAIIEDVIREQRERQLAAQHDTEDDDEEEAGERKYDGPYNGDYDYPDDEEDDDEATPAADNTLDDPAGMRVRFEQLYSLYASLKNIAGLGDGNELLEFIPENRHEEFTSLLAKATPWLVEFNTNWEKFMQERPADDVDDDDDEFIDIDDDE